MTLSFSQSCSFNCWSFAMRPRRCVATLARGCSFREVLAFWIAASKAFSFCSRARCSSSWRTGLRRNTKRRPSNVNHGVTSHNSTIGLLLSFVIARCGRFVTVVQEMPPIRVVMEDSFALVAAGSDVTPAAHFLDPQRSRNDRQPYSSFAPCQLLNCEMGDPLVLHRGAGEGG